MKKIFCALLVALGLTIVPAAPALANAPVEVNIQEPTVIVKGVDCGDGTGIKCPDDFDGQVQVKGVSVAIWGTNGTSLEVNSSLPEDFQVPVFFEDPIVAINQ